jgi:hypothetical protein
LFADVIRGAASGDDDAMRPLCPEHATLVLRDMAEFRRQFDAGS